MWGRMLGYHPKWVGAVEVEGEKEDEIGKRPVVSHPTHPKARNNRQSGRRR